MSNQVLRVYSCHFVRLVCSDYAKRIASLIQAVQTCTAVTVCYLQNERKRLNSTRDVLIHSVALFGLIWLKLHL